MQLILSGNPNLNTVRSVVYLANKQYSNNIKNVLFIDNSVTLFSREGEPLESKRNDFVRGYIDNVSIESVIIERQDFHQAVPKILSEKLSAYGHSKIIVDLTNGDKFISNTLYASASLSKIENLFFLVMDRDKREEPPENLSEEDYKIDVVSPLANLESIGKYTYFDILYYRNKADEIITLFEKARFHSNFLSNSLSRQLDACITNYFLEKYSHSISDVGQLIEEITGELSHRIKSIVKKDINASVPKGFNKSVVWLSEQFCNKLRSRENQDLAAYHEDFKELQSIDKLIDLIRTYRNISVHPYDCLRGREEAKLVLNTSLYTLEIIGKTKIFNA